MCSAFFNKGALQERAKGVSKVPSRMFYFKQGMKRMAGEAVLARVVMK